jgi:hypothetical protein
MSWTTSRRAVVNRRPWQGIAKAVTATVQAQNILVGGGPVCSRSCDV